MLNNFWLFCFNLANSYIKMHYNLWIKLAQMFLPCLTFFLSLGGSFRALMSREAALGTTSTLACLFWTVNFTVIFSPFQSPVFFCISSPIFFGDYNVHDHIVGVKLTLNLITVRGNFSVYWHLLMERYYHGS